MLGYVKFIKIESQAKPINSILEVMNHRFSMSHNKQPNEIDVAGAFDNF